jgi:ketosteroid isomerase-like protein
MARIDRILLLIVVVLLLVAPGCRQESPADAEKDVTAVIDAFYGGIKSGNSAATMAVVAPDALFVETGKLETRSEYEMNHLPNDIAFEKQVTGKRNVVRLTVNGDTAWMIAATEYHGTFDGADVDFVSSQLAVLSREDGTWKIRSIHWSSRPA